MHISFSHEFLRVFLVQNCALKINVTLGSIDLVRMQTYRSPGVLVCLSAFLLMLSAYLATIEVPVRITDDPHAAEQFDIMRAYLPFGFAILVLALVFLVCGIVLGARKLSTIQLRTVFSRVSLIVGLTLGFLALTSIFLPWVIAKTTEPFIETRGGTFNVGQYHALTGINLMTGTNNMAGDIILLLFVGAIIGILHIPLLTLLEGERTDAMKAFLFLLGGICIIVPLASIHAHRIWWISLRVNGTLGFSVVFESAGIGFLIATSCAIGLIAYGLITTIKLAR
jgi:hypothetical protein